MDKFCVLVLDDPVLHFQKSCIVQGRCLVCLLCRSTGLTNTEQARSVIRLKRRFEKGEILVAGVSCHSLDQIFSFAF